MVRKHSLRGMYIIVGLVGSSLRTNTYGVEEAGVYPIEIHG